MKETQHTDFDYKNIEPEYVLATGGVFLALGITYYLLTRKKTAHENSPDA